MRQQKTLDFLRRFDYIIAFMFFNCTNVSVAGKSLTNSVFFLVMVEKVHGDRRLVSGTLVPINGTRAHGFRQDICFVRLLCRLKSVRIWLEHSDSSRQPQTCIFRQKLQILLRKSGASGGGKSRRKRTITLDL